MTTTPAASFPAPGSTAEVEGGAVFTPRFDKDGLIAAIVTEAGTGNVLMFAWMNAEALAATIATREAHFWSRSRKKQWRKGEESGNTLAVVELRTDCDQDALWLRVKVRGDGVACHTGAPSCFYRALDLTASETPATSLVRKPLPGVQGERKDV